MQTFYDIVKTKVVELNLKTKEGSQFKSTCSCLNLITPIHLPLQY